MNSIRVKKFDPKSMKRNRVIFIIRKRHTGKSVLMKDLLYHMPRPDFAIAMAPTEDTLRMFREFLPECCIFDHFSQPKLERLVMVQRELVNRNKNRSVLILLDDCLYQKGVLKSNAMRSIFFNGRHDHITLICSAQYMMDVDVSLRTNIDYIFTMRETILTNRQKLYKYYFGQFPKFDDFDKVMAACTQDYKCMVLDGTMSSCKQPTDCVLWYKARTDVPSFKLCKEAFWKLTRQHGISREKYMRAQTDLFDAETSMIVDGKRCTSTRVETEDENGCVTTS